MPNEPTWDAVTSDSLRMPGEIKHLAALGDSLIAFTDRGVFRVKHIPPRWWHRLGWMPMRAWYAMTAINEPTATPDVRPNTAPIGLLILSGATLLSAALNVAWLLYELGVVDLGLR